jgi:hypothetical protein
MCTVSGQITQPIPWPDSADAYCSSGTMSLACPPEGTLRFQDGGLLLNVPSYVPDAGGEILRDGLTGLRWETTAPMPSLSFEEAQAHCQGLTLGGVCGWRVPSRVELLSIVDFGKAYPYLPKEFGPDFWTLWTSTPGVADPSNHWVVDTSYCGIFLDDGTSIDTRSVRCVLGPTLGPTKVQMSAGDAIDLRTGLEWYVANPLTSNDWTEAMAQCSTLHANGYRDWRLPSAKELLSVVDDTVTPGFPPEFLASPSLQYWTSTPAIQGGVGGLDDVLVVFSDNGTLGHLPPKGNPLSLYCVRGGAVGSRWPDSITPVCVATDGSLLSPCDQSPHTPGQDGDLQVAVPTYLTVPEGVQDLTTGLIWETTSSPQVADQAAAHCQSKGGSWRLPSVKELVSLLDYGVTSNQLPPLFDQALTSLLSDELYPAMPNFAWVVEFTPKNPGTMSAQSTSQTFDTRCVLGPAHTPLLSQQGGPIADGSTGLQWAPSDLEADSWNAALSLCPAGWRLPTIKEWASISSPGSSPPFASLFNLTGGESYWSSTPLASDPAKVWVLDGQYGSLLTFSAAPGLPLKVRCVRGP